MNGSVLLAAACLLILAWIAIEDLRTLHARNVIVYPAIVFALGGSVLLDGEIPAGALVGGLAAFALMVAAVVGARGRMGWGDAKVGAFCGVVVGAHGVVPMLAITFFSGGVVAAVLLASGLRRRSDAIAYTPFLLVGVVATLLLLRPYEVS